MNKTAENTRLNQQANALCTVIVNSCDDYEDTWYPFFKIFKAEWPDCKFPIILNTESCRAYG